VVVGAGAKPFIAYTIASVTDHGAGDEVIYPVPGFPIYESQIVANGAVPVPVFLRESRDFAFDPSELEAAITPKTRLVILNTPHNPTGGILRAADLDAIAAILDRHPRGGDRSCARKIGVQARHVGQHADLDHVVGNLCLRSGRGEQAADRQRKQTAFHCLHHELLR